MPDDDLTPFAYGAIYGSRSWNVDPNGWLIGPVYPQPWTPGENVAGCRVGRVDIGEGRSYYRTVPPPGGLIEPGHMLHCNCGWHAYLDGSADYANPSRVNGVVALYGRGVIHERGGRFIKARIVALQLPDATDPPQPTKDTSRLHAVRHAIGDPTLPMFCCTPLSATWRPPMVSVKTLQKVRDNYPGIPFYDSLAEMVQRHPTTPPKKKEQ